MGLQMAQDVNLVVDNVDVSYWNPGLTLDKFHVAVAESKDQRKVLDRVVEATGDPRLLMDLNDRRIQQLGVQRAVEWKQKTAGPLTLHLARANTMENAGICLQPLYGFTYFPGSGLKGLARAYAETVWLEQQDDPTSAWETIEDVFGWADNPLRNQQIDVEKYDRTKGLKNDEKWKLAAFKHHPAKPRFLRDNDGQIVLDQKGNQVEIDSHGGAVVFLDAWPMEWPPLVVDIVNNHYKDYYQTKIWDQPNNAPGEWHYPNPVNFLAIPAGIEFSFAVTKRSPNVDDRLLTLAQEWLQAALVHLGAGAKTAAGYGRFHEPDGKSVPSLITPRRKQVHARVSLESPAFLAGAEQGERDCELRPATLRGMLRKWWRTMHSGYVETATLAKLEALLWGDVNGGNGAITTHLVASPDNPRPQRYNRDQIIQQQRIPRPENRRTSIGLVYGSYGMDDGRNHRWYLPVGAKWTVTFTVKALPGWQVKERGLGDIEIPLDIVQRQAQAALWLLASFGGVGSKSRHGFGSLSLASMDEPPDPSITSTAVPEPMEGIKYCRDRVGAELRNTLGLGDRFDKARFHAPSLASIEEPREIDAESGNVWHAANEANMKWQAFAQKYKHREQKVAMGLPRSIHGRGQQQRLNTRVGRERVQRHASPVHVHLLYDSEDKVYWIRVLALHAPHLPNASASREFLGEMLDHMDPYADE